jgi:hypothetical protein
VALAGERMKTVRRIGLVLAAAGMALVTLTGAR